MEQDYLLDFELATVGSSVLGPTVMSVQRLYRQYQFIWVMEWASGIARSRNVLATRFLKRNLSPYLIFLDGDIVFEPLHINKVLSSLRNNYDLIGGCYSVKDGSQLASRGLGDGSINLDGKIQEIDYLATGFMGISRRLLLEACDKLNLPLMHPGEWAEAYPFFEEYRHTHPQAGEMWLSEDWEFCEKVKRIGTKVYLDTSIWVGHIGQKCYTVSDVIAYWNKDKVIEQLTKGSRDEMEQYNIDMSYPAPVILDIGASIGDFSIWALKKWNGAKIYAYEPISKNFEYLVKNVEGLNVIPIKSAVRNNGAELGIMYHGINNIGEASFYNLGEQNTDLVEEVTVIDAKSLPSADIVKIDTEGCEVEILEGLDLSNIKAVMLEAHRKEDLIRIQEILKDLDLISMTEIMPSRWIIKFIKRSVGVMTHT